MGAPARKVQAQADARPRVVITGMAGRLGRRLARRLHRMGDCRVVGLDRRPFPGLPRDVEHHELDLRSKRAREVFRQDVRALVHVGTLHDPRAGPEAHHQWNIVGTQRLFEYCSRYRVGKVIVLSSANVYGPRPDNPQFLTEDSPLLAGQQFPAIRDLVELDMMATSFFWKAPEVETVVLRPVHILGAVHNAPSNYLRLARPPVLLGFDPMVQVIHQDDVIEAMLLALGPGRRGVFNLVGPGELPLSAILRELSRRPLYVPHFLARPALETLWRTRLTSFPVPELDHLQYVCMVDGSRARRELGFVARKSLRETIHAVEMED